MSLKQQVVDTNIDKIDPQNGISSPLTGVLLPSASRHIHYSSDPSLPQHLYNSLICPINLKLPQKKSRLTHQTFAELCSQNYKNKEPLSSLRKARRILRDKGILLVYDTSQTHPIDRYVKSLFCCAGFSLIYQQDNCSFLQKSKIGRAHV